MRFVYECKLVNSFESDEYSSVLGIIAIPGMMTGAILGGSSVHQAAKLQMIIMFMITASTTLASVFVSLAAIAVTVDKEHRIRGDRIESNGNSWFNIKHWNLKKTMRCFGRIFRSGWSKEEHGTPGERQRLLA